MPQSVVIPELPYSDVRQAAEWLCKCFGFVERLRIGNHRSQLCFGQGAVIVIALEGGSTPSHSVMVRVVDVDAHCALARQLGVRILNPPTDYPYGERQYTAEDIGGHKWTFSKTIADVDPRDWGGTLVAERGC